MKEVINEKKISTEEGVIEEAFSYTKNVFYYKKSFFFNEVIVPLSQHNAKSGISLMSNIFCPPMEIQKQNQTRQKS